MALRGRTDNTDRFARTFHRLSVIATEDPLRRTRRVLSTGAPDIGAASIADEQIIARDFRTALNVGDTEAGVRFDSDGIEGFNSSVTQTFDINTDGSGFLGTGGTQITWGTTGTVSVPGSGIDAGTIDELQLAEEAVTNAKIAVDAIQGDVIAASAITSVKISDNAIEAPKIAAGAVVAGKIDAGAVTATEIASNAITAVKIQAGAVTAAKITVTSLSAISANMGTITAGTITGGTIRSASSGQRVEMNSSGLEIHGTPGAGPITQSIQFKSTAGGSSDGYLAPHGSGGVQVGGDLRHNADSVPVGNGLGSVGVITTGEWGESYIQTMYTDIIEGIGLSVQIHSAAGTNTLGFFGATPVTQQNVTGSRSGNAALASLLTNLANQGLILDGTTA